MTISFAFELRPWKASLQQSRQSLPALVRAPQSRLEPTLRLTDDKECPGQKADAYCWGARARSRPPSRELDRFSRAVKAHDPFSRGAAQRNELGLRSGQ